ncbi:MAG TPA: hypothetical protein VFG83_13130 [Kofleriaceae bacterium]|nr:hypothetical protein [Kofleriaceae bacterium]
MTDAASVVLEMVYRYRQLCGRCEAGLGLDMDEVMEITAIESRFSCTAGGEWSDQRQFSRTPVTLSGRLSSRRFNDPIQVTDLGPGGMVIADAPYLERGDTVEIAVGQKAGCFRFVAEVAWIREDGPSTRTGLSLRGIPLLLRQAPKAIAAPAPAPAKAPGHPRRGTALPAAA